MGLGLGESTHRDISQTTEAHRRFDLGQRSSSTYCCCRSIHIPSIGWAELTKQRKQPVTRSISALLYYSYTAVTIRTGSPLQIWPSTKFLAWCACQNRLRYITGCTSIRDGLAVHHDDSDNSAPISISPLPPLNMPSVSPSRLFFQDFYGRGHS